MTIGRYVSVPLKHSAKLERLPGPLYPNLSNRLNRNGYEKRQHGRLAK